MPLPGRLLCCDRPRLDSSGNTDERGHSAGPLAVGPKRIEHFEMRARAQTAGKDAVGRDARGDELIAIGRPQIEMELRRAATEPPRHVFGRVAGSAKGQISYTNDAFHPTSEEELDEIDQHSLFPGDEPH